MIRLMIVAGESSDKLATFLRKRGTFEIESAVSNFSDNLTIIQNKIIRVDKLLYLYHVNETTNEPDMNIKSDMQALRSLLHGDSFFNPGEIIFISNKGEMQQQAIQYFKTIMLDCNYENYSIKLLEGKLSFTEIYSALIGLTVSSDFKNTYTKLYRIERNEEADVEYEANHNTSFIIEPFLYNNVDEYHAKQETSKQIESGVAIHDSGETNISTFNNPVLGQIDIDSESKQLNVLLISGVPKSGKSIWSSVLASSSIKCDQTTCVIDLTENNDILAYLDSSDTVVQQLNFIDLLRNAHVNQNSLVYCKARNVKEQAVRMEFLQNFLSMKDSNFSTIIITTEECDSILVLELLSTVITDILMTANSLTSDIIHVQNIFNNENCEGIRKSILLNENIVLMENQHYNKPEELKLLCSEDVRIIKTKRFKSIQAKQGLFKSLIL